MPWHEVDTMSLRREFIMFATQDGSNIRELCRRFGISPKTGYKWIRRYHKEGLAGLGDRSRRPHRSPASTPDSMVRAVLQVRKAHPAWGGRKIHARLLALGHEGVSSPSTITQILKRKGLMVPSESAKRRKYIRFEANSPNELWQMDFKGYKVLLHGRCYPLTVLDDHSRFSIGLEACENERRITVKDRLVSIFRHYGLPARMLMDNGAPWGTSHKGRHSMFAIWLMRMGIRVTHTRPYNPQTIGKDERFHRTLDLEVFSQGIPLTLKDCQKKFDTWRDIYNFERPHEALDMKVPGQRYKPSPLPYPEILPSIEYLPEDEVRKVQDRGWFSYKGWEYRLPRVFKGQPVAVRPTPEDSIKEVYFCHQKIATLNMKERVTYW